MFLFRRVNAYLPLCNHLRPPLQTLDLSDNCLTVTWLTEWEGLAGGIPVMMKCLHAKTVLTANYE